MNQYPRMPRKKCTLLLRAVAIHQSLVQTAHQRGELLMRTTFRINAAVLSLLFACCATALAAGTGPPHLPPLTDPATNTHIRGKFVWADMFASDVETARSFYQDLFGWDWQWVAQEPVPYGMFYKNELAVGGLVYKEAQVEGNPYGRWIHYISSDDIAGIEAEVVKRGGRALLSTKQGPARGEYAIMADPEGALIGAINSSSGDPDDFRAEYGEWIWVQLYARDAVKAANFYATLFGYNIQEYDDNPEIVDWVLAVEGYSRASVGELEKDSEHQPTWLGFIRVEDMDATLKKAASLGGTVLFPPRPDVADGDLAVIADPLGTPVGLLRWDFPEEEEEQQ
jgi:predicted enzyme related to lactoylglutathione lyase